MKRFTATNIILGIIAAEVVCLTVQAIADRPQPTNDGTPTRGSGPKAQAKAQPAHRYFPFWKAVDQLAGWLRNLFTGNPGYLSDHQSRQPGSYSPKYTAGHRSRHRQPRTDAESAPSPGQSQDRLQKADGTRSEAPAFKGSLEGLSDKLKDPAWAGMLAANDGNVALTDAARAVPTPTPGRFVDRLDRNPYIGKGMKNHTRNPR